MRIDIYDNTGSKKSSADLPEKLNVEVNEDLFYEVVKMQMACKRSGTASTKGRSEVKGSNAKPYRQKGTGNARAGSKQSPIWRSGGTVFGPKPRDFSYSMPKKMVRAALRSAISYKAKEGKLRVLDSLEIAEPKTKALIEILKANEVTNALVVSEAPNDNVKLAARNIRGVKFLFTGGINVYDVLNHDVLVITSASLDSVGAL